MTLETCYLLLQQYCCNNIVQKYLDLFSLFDARDHLHVLIVSEKATKLKKIMILYLYICMMSLHVSKEYGRFFLNIVLFSGNINSKSTQSYISQVQ